MRRRFTDERGFSIVEVTVGGALLLLVSLVVLQLFDASVERAAGIEDRSQRLASVRVGVDELVRDLRQAWTGDPATPPISAVGATSITFFTPDRSTPVRLRRVSYRVSSGRLERSVTWSTNTGTAPWTFGTTGPWVPVVDAVRPGGVFVAVDEAGVPTTNPALARRIDVTFDVPGSRGGSDHDYRTSIDLRNGS
jgi:Tfp pilus assembly protein PilW